VRAHHSGRAGMLMAREFPKSQIRLNGPNKSGLSRFDKKEDSGKLKELHPGKCGKPNWSAGSNKSNQGRFDKTKEPGKLKESPRGTERKFRNTMSACFLRTQQRAKSQCIIDVQPPSGLVLRSWFRGDSHDVDSWLGCWFPVVSAAGGSHSTESLILAQDERWRRA
jgi:hypothetical protein